VIPTFTSRLTRNRSVSSQESSDDHLDFIQHMSLSTDADDAYNFHNNTLFESTSPSKTMV
jgi:hypothetical protein